MLAYFESDQGRRLLASGNVRQIVKRLSQLHNDHAAEVDAQIRKLTEQADLVVANMLCEDSASCVAEASRIPLAALHCFPWRRTRGYAAPGVTARLLPPPLALASWSLVERLWWQGRRATTNRLRAELGLAPANRSTPARMADSGALAIQAYHPALVPRALDWGPTTPVLGFLTPSTQLRARLGDVGVDGDLRAWLEAGEPPVYFGFGSMPVVDPAATLEMIRTVAERCGIRAVIGAGWSRLAATTRSEQLRVVGAVDHDVLLPQCRAAVHHGGAGTTAAALLAGIPAVVCSVIGDQPFWGARLMELGIGTHLRFRDITADSLTSALQRVLDPACAARARQHGQNLRTDTGAAARTAEHLERHARHTA